MQFLPAQTSADKTVAELKEKVFNDMVKAYKGK